VHPLSVRTGLLNKEVILQNHASPGVTGAILKEGIMNDNTCDYCGATPDITNEVIFSADPFELYKKQDETKKNLCDNCFFKSCDDILTSEELWSVGEECTF
jgi:hypothetical protein